MKQSDPENSLKAQFTIFRSQKYVKKGYMEMREQLYLEPLKSAPGRSVFHYFWCKSKELRHRISRRFPCVTPVIENVSSELLQALTSYWTESQLQSCQTSMMELFCKNIQRSKDAECFYDKALLQMFDWIPNTLPIGKLL